MPKHVQIVVTLIDRLVQPAGVGPSRHEVLEGFHLLDRSREHGEESRLLLAEKRHREALVLVDEIQQLLTCTTLGELRAIAQGLEHWCSRHHVEKIADLTGKLETGN